jgi:hypothetical protein
MQIAGAASRFAFAQLALLQRGPRFPFALSIPLTTAQDGTPIFDAVKMFKTLPAYAFC